MTGTTVSTPAAPPRSAMPPTPDGLVEDGNSPISQLPDSIGNQPKRLRDDPRVPAFLISTIVHTLLILVLALLKYQDATGDAKVLVARQGEPSSVVTLQAIERENQDGLSDGALVDQPITVNMKRAEPLAMPSPVEMEAGANSIDPRLLRDLAATGGVSANQSPLVRLPGGGLSGRTPEGRLQYGRKYGATPESEQAVDLALAWLAEHQRDNGSWSFDLELDPCKGRCRNSKKKGSDSPTPSTAATGLALLAFLGAGHTHHLEGPYQETVRRGLYYLRAVAAETEFGYDWQQGSMYGHGIALMALGEALSMASEEDRPDRDLFGQVARGATFTCIAQHDNGSWGYVPGRPGDTTVTGWQVLSLVAARRNRIHFRTNALYEAKEFILSTSTDRDYSFGYKGPPGEPTTTAIGLTLMLYLGESPDNTRLYMALCDLARRGPMLDNIYHDYYATLALHHSRNHYWDEWNSKLRDHLVASQSKSGHEQGSWHFPDRWGDIGGRLYTTAMCAMTLEVYYRYLPLYESIDDFPL